MKTCTKCGVDKPLREFYSHPTQKSGLHPRCKECIKVANAERHRRNPAKHNAYKREHYQRNLARERAKRAEYERQHPKEAQQRVARWKERHPEKVRAQDAVMYALRTGALVRPGSCQRCPSAGPLDAHHHDYSKPLDVEWLCGSCHVKADTERRQQEALAS